MFCIIFIETQILIYSNFISSKPVVYLNADKLLMHIPQKQQEKHLGWLDKKLMKDRFLLVNYQHKGLDISETFPVISIIPVYYGLKRCCSMFRHENEWFLKFSSPCWILVFGKFIWDKLGFNLLNKNQWTAWVRKMYNFTTKLYPAGKKKKQWPH